MTGDGSSAPNGVVIYKTTTAAYASEVALHAAGLQAKVIGVPRSLSTDCCLGVRIRWLDHESVRETLRKAGIEFLQVYPWPGQ